MLPTGRGSNPESASWVPQWLKRGAFFHNATIDQSLGKGSEVRGGRRSAIFEVGYR